MKWFSLTKTNPAVRPRTGLSDLLKVYGFATLGVIGVTVVELLFIDIFQRVPLFFYWPIVVLIGWIGGLAPGFYAAILSIVLARVFIFPTRTSTTETLIDFLVFVMFCMVTMFMAWLRRRENRIQERIDRHQLETQITLASIGDGVIVVNTEGMITFINPVAAELTGWPSDTAIGQHITEVFVIVDEETGESRRNPVLRALEEGVISVLENHTVLRAKNGEEWPISDSGAPIRNNTGDIIGGVLVFRDMSEKRSRERALEESEARYRQLVNNATDLVYTLDMDARIQTVNPVAEQITGYTVDELSQMALTDLTTPEAMAYSNSMLDRKLEGEDGTIYELEIITKDHHRRIMEVNSQLIMEDGVPVGIEGIARDVTTRKEAERRIRTLHDISATLATTITLQEVASVIIDHVLKVLGAHHGAVGLVSADGKNLELLRLTNLSQEDFQRYRVTPLSESGPLTDAMRAGEPVWITTQADYVERYPDYKQLVENVTKTHAAAALPLQVRSKVIGGMMVSFPDARTLSSDERSFLETVADYCAQSIERAQLFEAEQQTLELLQRRVHQQFIIAEIGQQALTDRDLTDLMQTIVQQLSDILNVEYTKVLELLPDGEHLLLKAGVGWKDGLVGQAVIKGTDSQAGYTLSVSEPVIVEDLNAETRFDGPTLLYEHNVVSGMSVIIQTYLKPYGVLGIHSVSKRTFTQDDIYFLQSVANILGAALERTQLDTMLETQRQWLTNIVDTVPGIIWETHHADEDEGMKLTFISAYVETMLGYTVEEALHDRDFWFNILHPQESREMANAFYHLPEDESAGVMNFRAAHKDGRSIDVQALMTTIFEDGQPVGKRGVMMDVTERQHLLNVQERYARLLRRSNDELRQFAYVVSHDLQEPLRMVTSYMQLLEKRYNDQLDERAQEYIGFAVGGAAHMKELITALLAYSRVESSEEPFEELNLQLALDKALNTLLLQIEENNAVVTQDTMPVVKADPVQMTQLFQNLIGNALKFRREETLNIHIGAERRGDEWHFCVQDNGIGIADDSLERVFAIFQRLHTREAYPGTGIGLAICKKVVERHGGNIWVESTPDEGTTFFFTLPVV